LEPRPKDGGTGRERFRFGGEADDPSEFDLQFIAQGKLHRFGFKIDDTRVREEWLIKIVGQREITLYERVTNEDGQVVIEVPGLKGQKVCALAIVGGPENQSFLATVQATLNIADYGDELGAVIGWFKDGLKLIAPDDAMGSLGHLLERSSDLGEFASYFLKASSTGVDSLVTIKDEISPQEAGALLSNRIVSQGSRGLKTADDDVYQVFDAGEGGAVLVEREGEKRSYRVRVLAAHESREGQTVSLEMAEESDGTRRLLQLIPALHDLNTKGGAYFIDEIDRSLHPMLVRNFLEFFLKSSAGSRSQLIMTTHESNLLDQDLLRRDEVWFAEKDHSGATHIYSLIDFKDRNDLEIRKHYLQGRFGAVPFLGDIGRLPSETNQPHESVPA
jgi:hypothetical protein